MISGKHEDGSDKTEDELADEVFQAYQAHQQAQAEGTDFEPVLDLKPGTT